MPTFDQICDTVLRASYQISGFSDARVSFEQIINVMPNTTEDLRKIVIELEARGLVRGSSEANGIELTAEGLVCAQRLPPVSEPPLFQDI